MSSFHEKIHSEPIAMKPENKRDTFTALASPVGLH